MAINVSMTKPDYSIPDGVYPARLFQIIQIGSQEFGKTTPKPWFSPQILLGFELPTMTYENINGEEVANIKSGTYFLSLNPSKNGTVGLREIIDGLRGSSEYTAEELEKFDIEKFLGVECDIELSGVESKGVVYQNITAIAPRAKGAEALPTFRENILVTIDEFMNVDALNLPDWIKNKIMESQEYKAMTEAPEVKDENAAPFENDHFAVKPAGKEEEMPKDFLL